MLDTTRKLLAVNRGEAEPDDRDALAFQHMMGPEDLFAERLAKAKSITRQLLWRASAKGNLNSLTTNPYEDSIRGALIGSGLGMPSEEINPAEIFDQQSRVTRMGEGGIPSLDAVPDEKDGLLALFAAMGPLGMFVGAHTPLAHYSRELMAVVIGIFMHISTTILFEASDAHRFNIAKLGAILLGTALGVASVLFH